MIPAFIFTLSQKKEEMVKLNQMSASVEKKDEKGLIPTRQIKWGNITFFAFTTLCGFVGAPLYIYHFGLSASEIFLFIFFYAATSLSITVGFHRMFAHAAFKANALVRFLVLFFGAGSFEQSALKWAGQHRDHHRYVDTEKDPYSIKKGFFYAHIGWLIFWDHEYHYEHVRDLNRSAMVRHQHQYYVWWAITAGVLLPLLIGALTGHLLGAFLISVCARITFVYHSTWCINSVCHMFGKATYDIYSSAKDHWLAAIITNGEGYHNYHHHFPGDYRNAVRWYQWDPTKWIIASLARIGWAWDLKRVSGFRILAAKLAAEKQHLEDCLQLTMKKTENPALAALRHGLEVHYENVRKTLAEWEVSARSHQKLLRQQIGERHFELKQQAAERTEEARRRFQETLTAWKALRMRSFARL